MTTLTTAVVLALAASAAEAQPASKLDATTFVVLGEGLAAGMANFGLSQTIQAQSFPAQVAQQMQTAFPQPLVQGPGIGIVLGYPSLPVRVPTYPQTRVRIFPAQTNPNDEHPTLFVFNLAVPGMTVTDSIQRRPSLPLIQKDGQQTTLNLILGFPALILSKQVPLWTQLEYGEAMFPTLALVELGYYEALEAAVYQDPTRLPDPASFGTAYGAIVQGLRSLQAQVVVCTIPDPMDTAFFTSPEAAAHLLRVPVSTLISAYNLKTDDLLTRNALYAIGNQAIRKQPQPLAAGSVMSASLASQISGRLNALNAQINAIAGRSGAVVYDLHALFHRVRVAGIAAGGRILTADYLGGFYTLDGIYPGTTGHALLANEVLALLNSTYGGSFPVVDVNTVMSHDPVVQYRAAGSGAGVERGRN